MWETRLVQAYYNHEGFWVGQGHPVILESTFGDTKAVLAEIKEFLTEHGDEKPLTVDPEAINALWEHARQDPRKEYELELRTDDHIDETEDFEGVVQIQLWLTYDLQKAKETQEARQDPPEPEPEQMELF